MISVPAKERCLRSLLSSFFVHSIILGKKHTCQPPEYKERETSKSLQGQIRGGGGWASTFNDLKKIFRGRQYLGLQCSGGGGGSHTQKKRKLYSGPKKREIFVPKRESGRLDKKAFISSQKRESWHY